MAAAAVPKKSLRIGVMMDNVQLLDIVGIDLIGNLSREYMNFVKDSMPPELAPFLASFESHALDIEFFFLAPTLEPTIMTPKLSYVPNMTYDDCPRDLDIVLVGGPVLSHRPPQADKFMREAWYVLRSCVVYSCPGHADRSRVGVCSCDRLAHCTLPSALPKRRSILTRLFC